MTAGWLANRWCSTAWVWRGVLVTLVAGLAVINAAGVYAQLVAAHVGERAAFAPTAQVRDAGIAVKIEVAAGRMADPDRQVGQINMTPEADGPRSGGNAVYAFALSQ